MPCPRHPSPFETRRVSFGFALLVAFLGGRLWTGNADAFASPSCIDSIDGLASHSIPGPMDMFERLSCLDTLTDAKVVAMLNSDDPRLIGIGIQAADRRRRLDLLTSHPEFAVDTRQTLPAIVITSDLPPKEGPYKQSVADFYRGMMDTWFGVWPLTAQEVLDVVPEGADPWNHARPWAVNIHRTALRNDPAQMKAIFDDLRTRPAELRVFAIGWTFTMGGFGSAMTIAEARDLLADVPDESLNSMRVLEKDLPPDPALKNADFRSNLIDAVKYIRANAP